MLCSVCGSDSIKEVNGTHYICTKPDCFNSKGHRTEFKIIKETQLTFPYNIIFSNRKPNEFYRIEYIEPNHF